MESSNPRLRLVRQDQTVEPLLSRSCFITSERYVGMDTTRKPRVSSTQDVYPAGMALPTHCRISIANRSISSHSTQQLQCIDMYMPGLYSQDPSTEPTCRAYTRRTIETRTALTAWSQFSIYTTLILQRLLYSPATCRKRDNDGNFLLLGRVETQNERYRQPNNDEIGDYVADCDGQRELRIGDAVASERSDVGLFNGNTLQYGSKECSKAPAKNEQSHSPQKGVEFPLREYR